MLRTSRFASAIFSAAFLALLVMVFLPSHGYAATGSQKKKVTKAAHH